MSFTFQFSMNQPQQPEKEAAINPVAQEILGRHWDTVRWDIGGVFTYDTPVLTHLSMYGDELFRLPSVPAVASGILPCIWSLNWYESAKIMSPTSIQQLLARYASYSTPVFLNFDNPQITAGELDDKLGHSVLKMLVENNPTGKNGVYVANDALADKIKRLYPVLKVCAGVNRVVSEENRGAVLYNELAKKYATVALHPLDAFNPQLLESLTDKSKFQITVNDVCLNTCPCRPEHMRLLTEIRHQPWNVDLLQRRYQCLNRAECEKIIRPKGSRPLSLSYSEFEQLYSMGFRNFRIQGESIRNELTFVHFMQHWLYNDDEKVSNRRAMLYSVLLISRAPADTEYPTGIGSYKERHFE